MNKKLLLVAAIGAVGLSSALASSDEAGVKNTVPLKDGSTVWVFNDGKMAMENPYGRVERMAPGHVMETRDGQKITMRGDEVARLNSILFVAP